MMLLLPRVPFLDVSSPIVTFLVVSLHVATFHDVSFTKSYHPWCFIYHELPSLIFTKGYLPLLPWQEVKGRRVNCKWWCFFHIIIYIFSFITTSLACQAQSVVLQVMISLILTEDIWWNQVLCILFVNRSCVAIPILCFILHSPSFFLFMKQIKIYK